MSMEIQGLPVLGQPMPPRPPKPQPPGLEEVAVQVAEVQAELREAEAQEATLMDERQGLKAQQKALERARKALGQQRMPSSERDRQQAMVGPALVNGRK